jgi:hypothetical protein
MDSLCAKWTSYVETHIIKKIKRLGLLLRGR